KQNGHVTGPELLAEHVRRFNASVRSGDFRPMLELFADDAVLEFRGVPVGPFRGREAIADAYAARPPDDEGEVLAAAEAGDELPSQLRSPWIVLVTYSLPSSSNNTLSFRFTEPFTVLRMNPNQKPL